MSDVRLMSKDVAMDILGMNLSVGRKTPRKLIDYSEEELMAKFQIKCTALRKTMPYCFLCIFLSSSETGDNPKNHCMQDVHEAYQILLKVIKAKIMFISNFQKKNPVDPKEKVAMATSLFKKRMIIK